MGNYWATWIESDEEQHGGLELLEEMPAEEQPVSHAHLQDVPA